MKTPLLLSCYLLVPLVSHQTTGFQLPQKHLPTDKFTRNKQQLNLISPSVWTSVVPPCLGLIRSEYTVSYGYGFSTAWTAWTMLRQAGDSTLLPFQAYGLIFYGARLNAFLFIRNLLSSRIQEFNKGIEERAKARGNRFATRPPFILSCAFLFYGLAVPVWFTCKLSSCPSWARQIFKVLIGAEWFGFGLAALGDLTKSYVKQSEKDERYLVTSGIFSLIRHPNYSGEILGWTANAMAGLLAAALWLSTSPKFSVTVLANLVSLVLGWVGMIFVLLRATASLEVKQRKEYGSDNQKYSKWVASSWGGWQLQSNAVAEESEHEKPEIVPNVDQEEDLGSGI